MNPWKPRFLVWFAGPRPPGPPGYLIPRWLFLRALGLIYFSAFYSLVFQIRGLLGPDGLQPVQVYLRQVAEVLGPTRYWYVPTLLWLGSSDRLLMALCWVGMLASLLLVFNFWPRGMLVICFMLFLSFVSAAQDFSGYQSDGMLLSAGFVSFFFAPGGFRPGWGEREPPSRASLLLLQLLWFSIYFDSGVAKYYGGDPSWRDFTAMDQYYQNGPLPTWIGWYAQQLPHWFQAATAVLTVLVELVIVWALFLPRRYRIASFCIVTTLEIGIILTANYAFLNYLVLCLGFLLLDDRLLIRFLPSRWIVPVGERLSHASTLPEQDSRMDLKILTQSREVSCLEESDAPSEPGRRLSRGWPQGAREFASGVDLWVTALLLGWVLYAYVFLILAQVWRDVPLPSRPAAILEPFRIANQYGLFGRMTWKRFEIEFQGSNDGANWIAYPFRSKPQDPAKAPRIYAPYQPRFDWNLWFASLGYWRENPWVLRCEQQLLLDNKDVLSLFAANPFPDAPPKQIRAILWQYWFTDSSTKRKTEMWWRRESQGLYAPALERGPEGRFVVTAWPDQLPTPP